MEQIEKLVSAAASQVAGEQVTIELTRPDSSHGDFACSVALQLGKKLDQDPRQVAEAIATELRNSTQFTKVSIAGPGFINVRVSDELLRSLAKIKPSVLYQGQKVVIETNNPNPFKAMHIGHAFNAILGETVANLLEAGGADVHRVSYHGDVGAHVGKSMYAILDYIDGDYTKLEAIPEAERNSFMSKMYAAGAQAYSQDPKAKDAIDTLAAQSFSPEDGLYKQVYETCLQWSFTQIEELVARLGNKPIEKRYLESQADALGVQTVKAHAGSVFLESDGALVFPGSKYGSFDNVFVSSNGRGLYGARDLGLMQLKDTDYHADKSYIVTGEEQRDYFKGVIKAAELCLPQLKDTTVNIPTGTVKLTTGKMSSRTGDVVEVAGLFDQIAVALSEHSSQPDDAVMTGAMRYQFLKVRIGSDVIFDVNEASSIHGNSGPYLQYAYARACSVVAKAQVQTQDTGDLTEDEHQLLLKISEYSAVLQRSIEELRPHHLCNYLYELTQEFNRFYEKNRIIDDEREAARLAIVQRYRTALQAGLSVLGIPTPEKM